jgi:hypothetical protein
MSEKRSDVQVDGQHVELLPARTVLSTFTRAAEESYSNENGGALDSLLGQLPSLYNSHSGSGNGVGGVGGAGGGASRGI